jgi:hypothetical protein
LDTSAQALAHSLGCPEEGSGPDGRIEDVVNLPGENVADHRLGDPVRSPKLTLFPEGLSGCAGAWEMLM